MYRKKKYIGKYFESINKDMEAEMSTVYFNIMRVLLSEDLYFYNSGGK